MSKAPKYFDLRRLLQTTSSSVMPWQTFPLGNYLY